MYTVIASHINGPSIVHNGALVDSCPDLASAERMARALNDLVYTLSLTDLYYAIPSLDALPDIERDRVVRHLVQALRQQSVAY